MKNSVIPVAGILALTICCGGNGGGDPSPTNTSTNTVTPPTVTPVVNPPASTQGFPGTFRNLKSVTNPSSLLRASARADVMQVGDGSSADMTSIQISSKLKTPRYSHSAINLPDGRVLLVGGIDPNNNNIHDTEVFDPITETFSPGPRTNYAAYKPTLFNVPGGVLAIGMAGSSGTVVEFLDLETMSSTVIPGPSFPFIGAGTYTLLDDGETILMVGFNKPGIQVPVLPEEFNAPILFNWKTGVTTEIPEPTPKAYFRSYAIPVRLNSGKILYVGGEKGYISNGPTDSLTVTKGLLFDQTTKTFTETVGDLTTPRVAHTAILLNDGRVGIFGGTQVSEATSVEIYDPSTDTFTVVAKTYQGSTPAPLNNNAFVSLVLKNGQTLHTCGQKRSGVEENTIYIFDPSTSKAGTTGSMIHPRVNATFTLLNSGRMLVTGGMGDGGILDSAEIFEQ